MKKRVITAIAYVAILLSFYALKLFVSDYCFEGLVWLFAIIGTFEMARACQLTKLQKGITIGFAVVNTPLFVVTDIVIKSGYFFLIGGMVAILLIVVSTIVFDYEGTSIESLGKTILTVIYPNLFLDFLIIINHMDSLGLPLMFPFAITPLVDVFAFLFGRWFHNKFPKKLSPQISPNKTVIGGVGGLIGGVVWSAVLFVIWYFAVGVDVSFAFGMFAFCLLGLFIAVVTMIGDLVESAIKRKVGIKDMGNCLPGHGGVLDRIDSSLYACVVTFIVFVLISTI